MDQVDRLSINGLPLESKTPAQAKEELLGEIRIPAAIQVSLYVFAACYSSIFLPQSSQPQRQKGFSEVIYTLVLCIEWRALLTIFRNTIGFLLRGMWTRLKYGLGKGNDNVRVVLTSFLWQYGVSDLLETELERDESNISYKKSELKW